MRDFFQSEQKKPRKNYLAKLGLLVSTYLILALVFLVILTFLGTAFLDALPMALGWPYFLTMVIIFALARGSYV